MLHPHFALLDENFALKNIFIIEDLNTDKGAEKLNRNDTQIPLNNF